MIQWLKLTRGAYAAYYSSLTTDAHARGGGNASCQGEGSGEEVIGEGLMGGGL